MMTSTSALNGCENQFIGFHRYLIWFYMPAAARESLYNRTGEVYSVLRQEKADPSKKERTLKVISTEEAVPRLSQNTQGNLKKNRFLHKSLKSSPIYPIPHLESSSPLPTSRSLLVQRHRPSGLVFPPPSGPSSSPPSSRAWMAS